MKLYKQYQSLLLLIILTTCFLHLQAQDTLQPGKRLEILKADRYNFEKKDSAKNFVSLAGNVLVKQETTLFYCDSAVLDQSENILEAFGKIHINDADSIHTYANYLKYLGKEKIAYLKKNVRLTDGNGTLTTNDLEYQTSTKIGIYKNGGKLVNKKTTVTSTEGFYYGEIKDIIFKKKVVVKDTDYEITTDTLKYNTSTELATFLAPTLIKNGKRTIKTKSGFYDLKFKKTELSQRPIIDDSTYVLIANDIAFDDISGLGEAKGNVVYREKDSSYSITLLANNVKANRKTEAYLATQKPVIILKEKKDSIFIGADTIFTQRLKHFKEKRLVPVITDSIATASLKPDTDTTLRIIEAYYNVKIFSDSMQAVCDSLFYSSQDSAFRLFNNPIIWLQDNQITGDTIHLFTKNKKAEKLRVFENALMVSESKGFYNQVKGNEITGYFVDGNLDFLKCKGNAESIYYSEDEEGKFIGVNQATCDIIDVLFDQKKTKKIILRSNVIGTTYPMGQVNHADLKVRGFKWMIDLKPLSPADIFGN